MLRSRFQRQAPFLNMHDAVTLFNALKTRPILGVTCRGKQDGGGAQVHAILSAQAFARVANVPYFHTPLRRVAHAPRFDRRWAAKWETAFGLSDCHRSAKGTGKIVTSQRFLDEYSGPPPIIEARHFHKFFDADADRYLPLLDEFRASCPLVVAGKGQTRIAAVHIRRGDVAKPGSEVTRRLTSMDANARAIEIIQATWPGIEVRVFSQGPPEDFSRLPGGCKFYLDVDVFETLRQLLNADVLVTAKSSFSYVAALLSRGTVIYKPFWHSPLSSWTVRSPDGSFVY